METISMLLIRKFVHVYISVGSRENTIERERERERERWIQAGLNLNLCGCMLVYLVRRTTQGILMIMVIVNIEINVARNSIRYAV